MKAVILADSVSEQGHRLVTFDLTFPMFIQPQLLRHRAFSFSVQSTRAVPLREQIQRVVDNPAMPSRWGEIQKGMVATKELVAKAEQRARHEWLVARDRAVEAADLMLKLGLHQEVAGRILSPFAWCRCILSATEFDNFFALRIDEHAQGEIRELAEAMRDAMAASTPATVGQWEWHLPLTTADERATLHVMDLRLISAGRCARVSYLRHDGKIDSKKDLELGSRLAADGHWSALEHQASPSNTSTYSQKPSNFRGWIQYRKLYDFEHDRKAWKAAKA